MALRTGLRADIVGRIHDTLLKCGFLPCGRAEASKEGDELPALGVRFRVDAPHGGHTCKLHTILNDVVNLAVAHLLGAAGVQVRYARILICADHSAAAAIDAVAGGASCQELLPSLFECYIIVAERIGSLALVAGNGKVTQGTRHACFDCWWRR